MLGSISSIHPPEVDASFTDLRNERKRMIISTRVHYMFKKKSVGIT